MTAKRLIFWLGLCALLLVGVVIAWSEAGRLDRFRGRGTAEESAAVPPPTRVGALGRIEPGSEVLDIDAPLGDRVLRLCVEEGQTVSVGEELACLESHDVVLAEKNEIAACLEEAQARAQTTRDLGQAQIRAAELRLKTIKRLDPLRIDSQKNKVRIAEIDCGKARDEFERAGRLLANNAVAREDYERREVEFRRQQELVKSAQIALAEMEAKSALDQESALVEIEETRASLEQSLALIPVQSLEKKLAHGQARLQRTIIRAPLSGHVLKIRTRPGERIGNGPILQLGNTDEMHAVAEVYETDIPRVRVDQRATISCLALGAPLHGTVVQVGRMIYKNDVLSVDPAADADARVVEVRIRLDEPQRVAALTNLQVDVLIDVNGHE